jgi:hypothetical protein
MNNTHNLKPELDELAAIVRAVIDRWPQHDQDEREAKAAKKADIIEGGKALLIGRKKYLSTNAFNKWVKGEGLDKPPFADQRERTAALNIITDVLNFKATTGAPVVALFDACPFATPQDMMKWARDNGLAKPTPKRTGKKKKPKPEEDDDTKDDDTKDDDTKDDDTKEDTAEDEEPMDEDFEPAKIDKARRYIRPLIEAGKKLTRVQVAEATGVGERTAGIALNVERGRLEGVAEGRALAKEEKFTKAQQADVQRVIKAHARELQSLMIARQQELEASFEQRVKTEVKRRLDFSFPSYEAKIKEVERKERLYDKFVSRTKPIFTDVQYTDFIFCTHWDQRKALTEDRANRAFALLQEKKLYLTMKP